MSLNPLISRVKLPGRVFQLPSKGAFYEDGVLAADVRDGEIQVKPMSALTELKIRSADLLYSTKILGEVCHECVPEILKPGKLLSRDVDALFLFLVASTYGSRKQVRAIHTCESAKWHDYEVDLEPILSAPNNSALAHRAVLYTVDLPNGQVVKLKPVIFDESIQVLNLRTAVAKKESDSQSVSSTDLESILVADLMSSIEAVEQGTGEELQRVTDRAQITEWIRVLPKHYVDLIITAANAAAEWGFDFKTSLACKDCKQLFTYDIELNPINFFTG